MYFVMVTMVECILVCTTQISSAGFLWLTHSLLSNSMSSSSMLPKYVLISLCINCLYNYSGTLGTSGLHVSTKVQLNLFVL